MEKDDKSLKKLRDPSFSFRDNKKLIILLFQYHFYRANNFSLDIYQERIKSYGFQDEILVVLNKIIDNYEKINQIITNNMHKWKFGRLGNIEKAILTLGCYYLYFEKKISVEVIIYFCIKNSQLYCDEKAYRLINKVLHTISITKEYND